MVYNYHWILDEELEELNYTGQRGTTIVIVIAVVLINLISREYVDVEHAQGIIEEVWHCKPQVNQGEGVGAIEDISVAVVAYNGSSSCG